MLSRGCCFWLICLRLGERDPISGALKDGHVERHWSGPDFVFSRFVLNVGLQPRPKQLRRQRNPRRRAVTTFLEVSGMTLRAHDFRARCVYEI